MTEQTEQVQGRRRWTPARVLGVIIGIIVPIAILIAGAYGAVMLMKTSPRAERKSRGEDRTQARLVDVTTAVRGDQKIIVEAMGQVQPARSLALQPQVSGRIVSVNERLTPGGVIAEGEELVKIDPTDYDLTIRERQAAVAQAEGDLRIEMGQQEIARQEFELLGEEIPEDDRGLVLREPQLEKARADLDAAKVALEAARVALTRTTVEAPFNALVLEENVEVGTFAGTNSTLAELVGTDRFWVQLAVPVDDLRWIELPGPDDERGSPVAIYDEGAWGRDVSREGYVYRFTGNVDPESRMATLLVAVDDPLAMGEEHEGEPQLLLNSYVRAEIEGREVSDVVAVAREHLHGGNTVWVMDEDRRLDVREVEVAWRGADMVLVNEGLRDGELIVTSRLSTPVEGMSLRTKPAAESIELIGQEGQLISAGGEDEAAAQRTAAATESDEAAGERDGRGAGTDETRGKGDE